MSLIAQRCRDLGLELPSIAPRGLYRSAVRDGAMIYMSGQVSRVDGATIEGPVDTMPQSEIAAAGKAAAVNALAAINSVLAPDEKVRLLKLTVYMLSTPAFQNHSEVANTVSQVFADVLGEDGTPSRTAIGVASVPSSGAIEIDLICTASRSDS